MGREIFPFSSAGQMSPCWVVATTSRVTMGLRRQSLHLLARLLRGRWVFSAKRGSSGVEGGEWRHLRAGGRLGVKQHSQSSGRTTAVCEIASITPKKMAVITHPSMTIEPLQTASPLLLKQTHASGQALNFRNSRAKSPVKRPPCMLYEALQ